MYTQGPLFQPFGFAPAFFVPPPSFGEDLDYVVHPTATTQRHPCHPPRYSNSQPRSRRSGGIPSLYLHRVTPAGYYPWSLPSHHHSHHYPEVVVYDSSSHDSAAEADSDDEGELYPYPQPAPQTPVQHASHHNPRSGSSSSCGRAAAPRRQPAGYTGVPAYSPFAAHLYRQAGQFESDEELSEPVMQPTGRRAHRGTRHSPCTQHRQQLKQQQQPQFVRPKQQQVPVAYAAAAASAAPARPSGVRHVPIQVVDASTLPQVVPQQQQKAASAASAAPDAAASLARPRPQLSKAAAATVIQSWWRMRRLARQQPALKALMQASAQLQEVDSIFEAYKAEACGSFITHKQYLELNEMAMRVLLQLDCTPCGVAELRAVRRRLAASAMRLLDAVQASFSASVTASMEVPDSLVAEHLQSDDDVAAATPTHQQQQQPLEANQEASAGQQPPESGREQQQQQQQQVLCGPGSAVDDSQQQQLVRVVLRIGGDTCDGCTQTDPDMFA